MIYFFKICFGSFTLLVDADISYGPSKLGCSGKILKIKNWMICKYVREDLMVPRGDNPKKKMGKGIYTAGH